MLYLQETRAHFTLLSRSEPERKGLYGGPSRKAPRVGKRLTSAKVANGGGKGKVSILNVYSDGDLFADHPFVLPCRIGKKGIKVYTLINTGLCINILINTHTAHLICKREEISPL